MSGFTTSSGVLSSGNLSSSAATGLDVGETLLVEFNFNAAPGININARIDNVRLTVGSQLKIVSITTSGTTVTVEFEGVDGETYDLNKSTTMDFSVLDSQDSVTLSGTNTGSLEDDDATEGSAFYRVEQQ